MLHCAHSNPNHEGEIMEKTRKNLKITSIILLIMAGSTVLNILGEVFFGEFNSAALPEGAPTNTLLIAKIVLLAVSALFLWPQIYVAIKGIKIAKTHNNTKGHIFWAIVLLVFSIVGLISPTLELLRSEGVYQNVGSILSMLIEVCLYYEYIKYAKEIAKAH